MMPLLILGELLSELTLIDVFGHHLPQESEAVVKFLILQFLWGELAVEVLSERAFNAIVVIYSVRCEIVG